VDEVGGLGKNQRAPDFLGEIHRQNGFESGRNVGVFHTNFWSLKNANQEK
jgi:hypothetical protein